MRRRGYRDDAALFPANGVLAPSNRGVPTPKPALVLKAAPGLAIVLKRPVHTTDELLDQLTRPWIRQYAPAVEARARALNVEAQRYMAAQGQPTRPKHVVAQISHLYQTEPFTWVQGKPSPLLGTNLKTEKSAKAGVPTKLLALSPPRDGSGFNLCPFAGVCKDKCLIFTGKNAFDGARMARVRKTLLLHLFPTVFYQQLHREIAAFARTWNRRGTAPAVRLNGFSDVVWEKVYPQLFRDFNGGTANGKRKPSVRFYDYTKWPLGPKHRHPPKNYHLTYSWSERADAGTNASTYLAAGYNVAIVVAAWPPSGGEDANRAAAEAFVRYVQARGFLGTHRAVLADDTDARFNDGQSAIAVLFAKGGDARATREDVQSGEVRMDEAYVTDGTTASPVREFILRVDPATGAPLRFASPAGTRRLGAAARRAARARTSWWSRWGKKAATTAVLLPGIPPL